MSDKPKSLAKPLIKQSSQGQQPQQKNGKKKRKPAFQVRDMKHTFISLEKAFEYIGDNSRFQKRIMTILIFQWVFYSFFVMGMTLLFKTPQYQCFNNKTHKYDNCIEQQICDGTSTDYIIKDKDIIAIEFKLQCERSSYLSYLPALFFIGQGISALIMSFFADKQGRRKILLFCLSVGSIFLFSLGISPSVEVLGTCMFLAGFGMGGYETIIYAYVTEISGQRFRNFSTNFLFITWGLAQMIYAPLEVQITSWRVMCFIIGAAQLFSLILVKIYFVESPRYLVSKGRYKEARQVFKFISIFNLRPAFEFHLLEEMETYNNRTTKIIKKNENQIETGQNQNNSQNNIVQKKKKRQFTNLLAFCTNKQVGITTINMIYCWFVRFFVYYSIQFNIKRMGNSIHTSFFLLAISEVLAAAFSIPLKLNMQRISSFRLAMGTICICALILAFTGSMPDTCLFESQFCWQEATTLIIALLLKFSITFYAVILMTYTSEVYPTVLRSQGFGICMIFGQMGSTASPIFVKQATEMLALSPLSLLGVFGIVGYLQTYLLKETFQEEFQDYLFEGRSSWLIPKVLKNLNKPKINQDNNNSKDGQIAYQMQNKNYFEGFDDSDDDNDEEQQYFQNQSKIIENKSQYQNPQLPTNNIQKQNENSKINIEDSQDKLQQEPNNQQQNDIVNQEKQQINEQKNNKQQ